MTYLKNLMKVFATLIISIIFFILLKSFINNKIICNILSYFFIIIYFVKIYRNELINQFKKIKFNKKLLIYSLLLICLSIIASKVIEFNINIPSTNNNSIVQDLKKAPFLMGLNVLLIGPIFEEFTFRFNFNNKNNKISFYIYTLLFASIHLVNIKNILEILYFIPYLLMSLSISLQYYKNNNIFMSIIYHIINNIINVMILLV